MGCCCCCYLLVGEILDDPTIQLRASVGDIAFIRGYYRNVLSGPCVKGAMYVQDGALYYRPACGKRFCWECCKKNYQLTEIKGVEVLKNQLVPLTPRGNQNRHLRLKITIESSYAGCSCVCP